MMKLFLIPALVFLSGSVLAGNPGQNASQCLSTSSFQEHGTSKVKVSNKCSQQIFYLYCGDLKYSDKRCGDGPKKGNNHGYYTHSVNLKAGASSDIALNSGGSYGIAACVGSVGFGYGGQWEDTYNGSYRCLNTNKKSESSSQSNQSTSSVTDNSGNKKKKKKKKKKNQY